MNKRQLTELYWWLHALQFDVATPIHRMVPRPCSIEYISICTDATESYGRGAIWNDLYISIRNYTIIFIIALYLLFRGLLVNNPVIIINTIITIQVVKYTGAMPEGCTDSDFVPLVYETYGAVPGCILLSTSSAQVIPN